ncbi:MAG: glycoside hydrolase family 25 protein [Clostridia bacterium]|nr:glycoside hydrolase family 25 protein [Clostridia bacterium]MDO5302663.1 glycoside hydrolase family 25 protein [Clostridia bacterium]
MKKIDKLKRKWKRKLNKKLSQAKVLGKRTIMIIFIIVVIFTFLYTFIHLKSSRYDGLGDKLEYEESPYNMDYLYTGNEGKIYDDGTYRSRRGIDVSVFQGDIDWEKVKQSGVEFAMIRLGFSSSADGEIHMDTKFKQNLKGAKAAGIDVGVYFFSQATTTDEAIKEAKYVLKHIRFKGVKYPVAFDMEPVDKDDRIKDLTRAEKTAIADAFCQVIKNSRFEPIIYGNPTWLRKNIDLGYLTDYDLWLAHYTDATEFSGKFVMWQYTDSGRIDGIDGYVDQNLYFED